MLCASAAITIPIVVYFGHSESARDAALTALFNGGKPTFGALAHLCLFGPIAEETFFRGAVLGAFDDAGYPWWGLFGSAVLFAVGHGDIRVFPGTLLFGLVMVWLYRRTGSLLAPITAHILNNSAVAVIAVILLRR